MKILLLFLSLFIVTDDATLVTGKGFKGYVFNENQEVFVSPSKGSKRYTPTYDNIVLAEKILKAGIKEINKERVNQYNRKPKIDKKLHKYIRQYVGFLNDKGEKVLWVNFLWQKEYFTEKQYREEIIYLSDGGSSFWNIYINIDNKQLSNLRVNGGA